MIVVTGGAGFIGSNIVKTLNEQGHSDILVVDNLTDGRKFKNIADCKILDYLDQDDFINKISHNDPSFSSIKTIFHEGACSETTEWDGRFMLKNNYDYSKAVLHYCLKKEIQFIYASSAATYGNETTFVENPENEKPINVYGYSKFLFDQYVRRLLPTAKSQIAGCRYFNVYGPREFHKGTMSSVTYHFNQQMQNGNAVKLFEGNENYKNGEQQRDFIYVGDVVDVNLWFYKNPEKSGIFNVGTGKSQTFNDVANSVIDWYGKGEIQYIPFPEQDAGSFS